MEAATGDVLAWVGGRDFAHSRFDRAEQARRQVGSAFKPFVFAAAIEAGFPPTQLVSDQPMTVTMAGGEVWEPRNFGDSYLPAVTLRQALAESRNVATIRVAQSVGPGRVGDVARHAGLPRVPDVPSAALGVATASPVQLTAAFTPFANLGDRVEPRFIRRVENADGETLWEADEPRRERALDPAVAYVVTDILRDAVRRGTATAANFGLRVPTAGKTGTTNAQQDVWFVGFTPDLVGSIWIGFDQPRSIVGNASGGRLAAPIWGRIMRATYQHRDRPDAWPVPRGVTTAQVDRRTGAVIAAGCPPPSGETFREVFLSGTVPASSCPGGDPSLWTRLQWWWSGDQTSPDSLELATPTPPPQLETLPPDLYSGVDVYGVEALPEATPLPGEPGTSEPLPADPGQPPVRIEPVPVEPPQAPEPAPPRVVPPPPGPQQPSRPPPQQPRPPQPPPPETPPPQQPQPEPPPPAERPPAADPPPASTPSQPPEPPPEATSPEEENEPSARRTPVSARAA
jgi:membrane peptidoglycan carboxypeptidase